MACEIEMGCEGFHGARHAIPARAAQLDQIVWAGIATKSRPSSRSTLRNSLAFMRAVMDKTSENERSAYGMKRSALATTHWYLG